MIEERSLHAMHVYTPNIMHIMCVSLDVIANVICNSEKCYIRAGHESRIQCVRHCIAVFGLFPNF